MDSNKRGEIGKNWKKLEKIGKNWKNRLRPDDVNTPPSKLSNNRQQMTSGS